MHIQVYKLFGFHNMYSVLLLIPKATEVLAEEFQTFCNSLFFCCCVYDTSILHQVEGVNHLLDGLVPFPHILKCCAVAMFVKCLERLKTRNDELCDGVVSIPYFFNGIYMRSSFLLGLYTPLSFSSYS